MKRSGQTGEHPPDDAGRGEVGRLRLRQSDEHERDVHGKSRGLSSKREDSEAYPFRQPLTGMEG